jgi:hypothetical protein
MKGWERINNVVQFPIFPKPGDDYYWDYPNQKWVYVTDDMDMTWTMDRMRGYDAGPGEHLCPETEYISGKEWKLLNRVKPEGDTLEEVMKDIQKKVKQIEEQCKEK